MNTETIMYEVLRNGIRQTGCGVETDKGWAETALYTFQNDIYVVSRLGEYIVSFQKLG